MPRPQTATAFWIWADISGIQPFTSRIWSELPAVEKTASHEIGTIAFYNESTTGQNSTMIPGFHLSSVNKRYRECPWKLSSSIGRR